MIKQTSPVRMDGRKLAGKQNAKNKKPRSKIDATRQIKIQKALYEIADAASAVTDMQAFYARMHDIVGKLMYAGNFFIATYDEQSDLITWTYYVDTVDVKPSPVRLSDQHGATGWILRHGKTLADVDGSVARAIKQGEIKPVGTDSDGIGVPLKSDHKMIGVLIAQSYEPAIKYTVADIEILNFVAQHISTALTRARAIEETRERNAELQIINSVQEGLASKLDIAAIYELIGEKVREVFNVHVVDIVNHDPATNLISMPYSYEKGDHSVITPREPYGFRLQVINSRAPLLINQNFVEMAAKYDNPLLTGEWPKSALFVPLLVDDKVKSIISIQDLDRENAFSTSDVQLLQTLSNAMSVALENARLFEETQHLLNETEQRAQELATVNTVSAALAGELNLNALIELVGEQIRTVFKADIAFVALRDEEKGIINFPYQCGQQHIDPIQWGEGITSKIIQSGRPLMINRDMDRQRQEMGVVLIGKRARSFLGVPIFVGGESVGVVSVQHSEQEGIFTDSDQRLLSTIAANVGIALQNARLFHETQRAFQAERQAHEQTKTLRSVAQALNRSLSLREVFDLVLIEIQKVIPCDSAGIYQVQGNRRVFVAGRGFKNLEDLIGVGFDFNQQDDEIGYLISKSLQPLILENATEQYPQYFSTGSHAATKIRSYMAVPIVLNQKLIGLITLGKEEPGIYKDRQAELAMAFAAQAATAINNARLFDETQRLLKETEDRAAELAILNSVGEAMSKTLDVKTVAKIVGDKVRDIFNADQMGILLFERQANLIHIIYGYDKANDRYVDELQIKPLPLGKGLTSEVIASRQPLLLSTREEQDVHGHYMPPELVGHIKMSESWLGVPIMVDENVLGVVFVEDYRPHVYNENHLRLLQTLSSNMGVAIQNARLFDETQQHNAELQIINSVQAALAARLDIHGMYEAVGEKLREIFDYQDVGIYSVDLQTHMMTLEYAFEKGRKIERATTPTTSLYEFIIAADKYFVFNGDYPQFAAQFKDYQIIAGELPKSVLAVPVPRKRNADLAVYLVLEDVDGKRIFSESDVRLLQTLANSMSVALENARLFDETQRLLKVTEDRAAELAIINSVQEGLASRLEMQGIYDLVGDKIREIFLNPDMSIRVIDPQTNMIHFPYDYENGQRCSIKPMPLADKGFTPHVVRTRETLVVNENMAQAMEEMGGSVIPGTQLEKSTVFVPLIIGNQSRGVINLTDNEHEHAFGASDVRLLETIANSMSVALENARLFDETQRLLKETEQRNAELAIINSVQEGLASKLEMQAIYDLVGDKIREIFDVHAVVIASYDHITEFIHFNYLTQKGRRTYPEPIPFTKMTHHLIRTRQFVLINEDMENRATEFGILPASGTSFGKSGLWMPLMVGDEVCGVINLHNLDREGAFSDSEIRLLQTLTNSMSVALENARLWEQEKMYRKALQRELEIGREIQAGFLPETLPQVEGWEIAASLMSAREVAGDFYDAFELPDGTIGLVIADVCDKGVGAALFMTLFRSLIRAVANLDYFEHTEHANAYQSTAKRLQRAVSLTNNYIAETHVKSGMFATLFFGILDPRDGKLTYINGGHEPPFIIRSGLVCETLHKTGPAVGAIVDGHFGILETMLQTGDTFFAFTDGVPDCKNPRGDFYGRERLLEVLQSVSESSHKVIKAIEADLYNYIGGTTQFDDIALLAMQREQDPDPARGK